MSKVFMALFVFAFMFGCATTPKPTHTSTQKVDPPIVRYEYPTSMPEMTAEERADADENLRLLEDINNQLDDHLDTVDEIDQMVDEMNE